MHNDLYAVVGNPISHSKSPRIHSLFARQTGEQLEYTAIQAPEDDFANTVKGFFERGGKGLNITVPFKEQAWQLADLRTQRAERAGAANTLYKDSKGSLTADNTDGKGLVTDLMVNHGVRLAGKRLLVLGAGGAVRGVLGPILAEEPAALTIANRTLQKPRGWSVSLNPWPAIRTWRPADSNSRPTLSTLSSTAPVPACREICRRFPQV